MMNAALYTRVSTDEQNPEHQLRPLREYVERMGWTVAVEAAEQVSGRDTRRPKMRAIIAEARARRIKVVVVAKLDRWGRNASHCVESIRAMRARGCLFVAVDQGLTIHPDTGGMEAATSDLLLRVMGAVAEFEAALISERTRAGIRGAVEAGTIGQPTKPCHDCGDDRPKGSGAAWGKRSGVRVPLCGGCKTAGGSGKGSRSGQGDEPAKMGGSRNGRFSTAGGDRLEIEPQRLRSKEQAAGPARVDVDVAEGSR